MTTEIHDGVNGSLKKIEVEPLGEIKGKAEPPKPVDLCNAGDANGKLDKSGCESLAEKDESISKKATSKSCPETIPKQKDDAHGVEGEEDVEEPQDGNDYTSEEEDEGEEDERVVDGEPYEEEDEEEYVEDDDEEDGDDESEPPSKRRK